MMLFFGANIPRQQLWGLNACTSKLQSFNQPGRWKFVHILLILRTGICCCNLKTVFVKCICLSSVKTVRITLLNFRLKDLRKYNYHRFLFNHNKNNNKFEKKCQRNPFAIDTATNDFNSDQIKIRMEKITAHGNFYLYLNAELFGA